MAEKIKATYTAEFDTEQEKEDFEIAFRGWLKQYQQLATVNKSLAQSTKEGISAYVNFIGGW
jgi:hypothetical protein